MRRPFRFDLQVTHDTGFITEKPRRATRVEPAIPGTQTVCVSPPRHRDLTGDRRVNNSTSIALIFLYIRGVAKKYRDWSSFRHGGGSTD